jgi:hypothetical protein
MPALICQVADSGIELPCDAREGGGLRCERLDDHGDRHEISQHTIEHSLAGNGYACESFTNETKDG